METEEGGAIGDGGGGGGGGGGPCRFTPCYRPNCNRVHTPGQAQPNREKFLRQMNFSVQTRCEKFHDTEAYDVPGCWKAHGKSNPSAMRCALATSFLRFWQRLL